MGRRGLLRLSSRRARPHCGRRLPTPRLFLARGPDRRVRSVQERLTAPQGSGWPSVQPSTTAIGANSRSADTKVDRVAAMPARGTGCQAPGRGGCVFRRPIWRGLPACPVARSSSRGRSSSRSSPSCGTSRRTPRLERAPPARSVGRRPRPRAKEERSRRRRRR